MNNNQTNFPHLYFALCSLHFALREASAAGSSDTEIGADADANAVAKAIRTTGIHRVSSALICGSACAELFACRAVFLVVGIALASHIEASARVYDLSAEHQRQTAQIVPFGTALVLRNACENCLSLAHTAGVDMDPYGNVSLVARG